MKRLHDVIRLGWPLALVMSSSSLAAPLHSGYAMLGVVDVPSTDLDQVVYRQIDALTVYEALQTILQGTGYRLAGDAAADPALYRLYQQPYPAHYRQLGPAPLGEVLTQLGGSAWFVVVDPVNRLLSFERLLRYRND